ncbi:hypothetical protein L1987_36513 [Smallanthus sonchifolius]|uniref:Uncharacterized protein n=1 Tax=Smallanthus sonchifolius TaxID=185202 RepID=A0ACB9HDT1_9ASTR|nr:hypothetical protein L1987_36513 [Smallanthus sonchifolius]
MAARLGFPSILQHLIDSGCDINSRITSNEETPLMICAKLKQEECLRVLIKAGADLGLVNMFGQSAWSIAKSNKWSNSFQQTMLNVTKDGMIPVSNNKAVFSPLIFVAHSGDIHALKAIVSRENINLNEQDSNGLSAVMVTAMQVMLQYTLEKGNKSSQGFYLLHYASRYGDIQAVKLLITRGYDINAFNGDGYTPLMLAAREGNAQMCELLISCGSLCDVSNSKGVTALTLARKHAMKHAECVILDELARMLILGGGYVLKHTRGGKGRPHRKVLKMVGNDGVLRWGKSKRRNVVCLEADVGPSPKFVKRRKAKGDPDTSGVFRVVTGMKKEVHFVCEGGFEIAELWVRGIRLVTMEAQSGRLKSRVKAHWDIGLLDLGINRAISNGLTRRSQNPLVHIPIIEAKRSTSQ